MIFVDTGAWFAALVPTDASHRAATDFLKSNDEPLLTTDYVVDELLTTIKCAWTVSARRSICSSDFGLSQSNRTA